MARLLPAYAHPLPHHAYAHHALSSLQPETLPLVKSCTSTVQLIIIFIAVLVHLSLGMVVRHLRIAVVGCH